MDDSERQITDGVQGGPAGEDLATRLTADQLAEMRESAGKQASPFIDPAQLGRVERFVACRHEWATAILGKPFRLRAITNRELVLLDLAAHTEPAPPEPRPPASHEPGRPPAEPAARCAAGAHEWARIAAAFPVRVSVAYNYSGPNHYESHVSGAEHIIVREPLHQGRLHRAADCPLCWTPSRAKHLLFDLADPTNRDRVPSCKRCLRTAYHITGFPPGSVLLS